MSSLAHAAARQSAERRWPLCRLESALLLSAGDGSARIRLVGGLSGLGGQAPHQPPVLRARLGEPVLRCDGAACTSHRQPFAEQADQGLAVMVLIQVTQAHRPLHAAITSAAARFLRSLPAHSVATVVPVAGRVPLVTALLSPSNAALAALHLTSQEDLDAHLVDTIGSAIGVLRRTPPVAGTRLPPRRVIIVIGDGMDVNMIPRRFVELGDALASEDIALFPVAISVLRVQLPMLNLAELAWRSSGTFRWARGEDESALAAAVEAELRSLGSELRTTEVLTIEGRAVSAWLGQRGQGTNGAVALLCDERLSMPRPMLRILRGPQHRLGWRMLASLAIALTLGMSLSWLWLRRRPQRGALTGK